MGSFVILAVLAQVGLALGMNMVVINTRCGPLRGESSLKAPRVTKFLGVPFGKVARRFEKATFPSPWKEVKDATRNGPACYQYGSFVQNVSKMSEDCLNLDIYTPSNLSNSGEKRDVMVFIHGGGFTIGNSASYDGSLLSDYGDVVVVAIQYRLGLFGFLPTGGLSPSNLGLWDMKLALEWVTENIGSFGGDGSRVTVFGESAGSMSISYLMASPKINNSHFQRVILESGSAVLGDTMTPVRNVGIGLLSRGTNCLINGTDQPDIDCLKSVDVNSLMSASPLLQTLPFNPEKDGEFLPHSVEEIFLKYDRYGIDGIRDMVGNMDQYDAVMGHNGQEGQYLAKIYLLSLGDAIKYGISAQMFESVVQNYTIKLLSNNDKVVTSLSQRIADEYKRGMIWNPNLTMSQTRLLSLIDLLGDFIISAPTVLFSKLHSEVARGKKSYFYLFDHKPQTPSVLDIDFKGAEWTKTSANHADELPFVFALKDLVSNSYSPDAINDLSKDIMRYWTNFAKTGNPSYQEGRQTCQTWQPTSSTGGQFLHITTNKDYMGNNSLHGREEFLLNVWTSMYKQVSQQTVIGRDSKDNMAVGSVIAAGGTIAKSSGIFFTLLLSINIFM